MARKATSGSVADIVSTLVQAGFSDAETVIHAVKDAKPGASEKQIRKSLANQIVSASEERNR